MMKRTIGLLVALLVIGLLTAYTFPGSTSDVAVAAQATATRASVATQTTRIYFPAYDEVALTYNIYSANPDGSDRRLVVKEASQPDVNSTGDRITYRSWQADNRGLIERGVEGGRTWRYNVAFQAARPAFAPDDLSFFFQSREAGERPAIYRTQGEEYDVLRRGTSPLEGEAFSILSDGNSMVYKGCVGTDCGLFFTNIDGSETRQLTKNLKDTNPAVSPDGSAVVYMSQTESGTWDLYGMSITGTDHITLTNTITASEGLPAWSPDGETIAFVSDRGDEWAIWAMDPDGENVRKLFDIGGSVDGTVNVDVANSFGWTEEQLDWAPAPEDMAMEEEEE